MGMSNYLENKILDHTMRGVAYTAPAARYLALFTSDPTDAGTGTEVSGGAYARQAITCGTAAANGSVSNTAQISFPVATASWGAITHVGIFDAATAGNLLYHGALGTSQTVGINNQVVFNIGQLTVTAD